MTHIKYREVIKDGAANLTMAYNLQRYGTLSVSQTDTPNPAPTSHREPGLPTFLALGIALNSDLRAMSIEEFLRPESQTRLWFLRYAQVFLLLASSVVVMIIVWKITRSSVAAYVVLALVTYGSWPLTIRADTFYAEPLTAFLISILSLSMLMAVDKLKYGYFAIVGVLLGLLTLTKAVFFYMWPPFLMFCVFWGLWDPARRKKIFVGSAVVLLCFFSIVELWAFRNYSNFGRHFITERGGGALNIRAEFNMMNAKEYFAAFLLWSPYEITRYRILGSSFFDSSDIERLKPFNPNGFRQKAMARNLSMAGEFNERWDDVAPLADKALLNEAREKILTHPIRHMLTTILFGFRGTCIRPLTGIGKVYPFVFSSFIILFLVSLFEKNIRTIAVCLPSMFSYGFYAVLTHNIPRYNESIIPMVWIGLVILCVWCYHPVLVRAGKWSANLQRKIIYTKG